MNHKIINLNRILFGLVFLSNMLCAIEFVVDPSSYVASYEVANVSGGIAAIQGIGVTFMMWNVTYPFYIYKPHKNKTLAYVIILQQIVGLLGEIYIKAHLLDTQLMLASSIQRFIIFDAAGLLLLAIGYTLMIKYNQYE